MTKQSRADRHFEALTKDRDHWKHRSEEKESQLRKLESEYRRWVWANPDKAPPPKPDRWEAARRGMMERLGWLNRRSVAEDSIQQQIEDCAEQLRIEKELALRRREDA